MVIFSVAFILMAIFLVPILSSLKDDLKKGDFLKPSRLVASMHLVSIVPYLFIVAFDNDIVSPLVRNHKSMVNLDSTIAYYGLIQTLAFISILLGLNSGVTKRIPRFFPYIGITYTRKQLRVSFVMAVLIGLGAFFLFLSKIGGLNYLLNNLEYRTFIIAGNNYLTSLFSCLFIALAILIYSLREKKSITKILLVITLSIVIILVFSSMGGRTSTVYLMLLIVLVFHYGVKRIRKIPLRAVFIVLLMVIYFIAIPLIRTPGSFEYYSNNINQLGKDVRENFEIIFTQTSYVDHYLLIVNYFDIDNIWLGSSYVDLLTAPIPSTLIPNKAPVDDGVYLRTIAEGRDVRPSMPYEELFKSSWPPETLGIMYMNFWIPGVIIGMYLLGIIYKVFYNYMVFSKYSIFSILIYSNVIYSFHLSNLRIVQTLTEITLIIIFFIMFFRIRLDSIYK
ncbi:O-antigen polymerase [Peribacillus frigoritolerans]|uniref:O-antigen polymerase n=1 Tax=Peribacillus frigoritolerans TaxID=450367 RepID=UPI003D01E10F